MEDHEVVKMDPVEHHKAADSQPLHDVVRNQLGKPASIGKELLVLELPEKLTKLTALLFVVVINQLLKRRSAGAVVCVGGLLQVIVQFTVAIKAQALAHFNNIGRRDVVFIGDLLDADSPLVIFYVPNNAGDDLGLFLGQQVCQEIIVFVHRTAPQCSLPPAEFTTFPLQSCHQ